MTTQIGDLTKVNNANFHQAPLFTPKEVLCQLFKFKFTKELALGLPVQIKTLETEQVKKPVLIDNATRERYEMMEVNPQTKIYEFYIGEEMRIRVKNNTDPQKVFYFCVLYQDHKGGYQSIFPHSSPQVRSVHSDFKCLNPGQETVLSIPTLKLPKIDDFTEEQAPVRMILVTTVTDRIKDVVSSLKKRMDLLHMSPSMDQTKLNDGLVVFNYKFLMKRDKPLQ